MSDLHHRRAFVRTIALGASAGLLSGPSPSRADDPSQQGQEKEKSEHEAPDPIEVEADARLQLLLVRYGDQLDDEARKEIRRQVASVVRRGRTLRQFPLDNGDGPFPVFSPYRAPLS